MVPQGNQPCAGPPYCAASGWNNRGKDSLLELLVQPEDAEVQVLAVGIADVPREGPGRRPRDTRWPGFTRAEWVSMWPVLGHGAVLVQHGDGVGSRNERRIQGASPVHVPHEDDHPFSSTEHRGAPGKAQSMASACAPRWLKPPWGPWRREPGIPSERAACSAPRLHRDLQWGPCATSSRVPRIRDPLQLPPRPVHRRQAVGSKCAREREFHVRDHVHEPRMEAQAHGKRVVIRHPEADRVSLLSLQDAHACPLVTLHLAIETLGATNLIRRSGTPLPIPGHREPGPHQDDGPSPASRHVHHLPGFFCPRPGRPWNASLPRRCHHVPCTVGVLTTWSPLEQKPPASPYGRDECRSLIAGGSAGRGHAGAVAGLPTRPLALGRGRAHRNRSWAPVSRPLPGTACVSHTECSVFQNTLHSLWLTAMASALLAFLYGQAGARCTCMSERHR